MGLFGYGKSDYDKNTGAMKTRLERLVNDVYEMGADATNVGKTITRIILKLESVGFTKGGKDAEAVDSYISKLITAMEQDAIDEYKHFKENPEKRVLSFDKIFSNIS